MTDEKLLQRAGRGDEAAFLALYERHRTTVFRFAYRMLGSAAVAEELTHDCFLSLVRRPEGFATSNLVESEDKPNLIHRIFVDGKNELFFGYELLVELIPATRQFRVTVRPLSEEYLQGLLARPAFQKRRLHPSYNAAAFNSAPQLIGDGDTFTLDVLQSLRTGAKIVDVVTVSLSDPGLQEAVSDRPARDFTLEDVQLKVTNYKLRLGGETVYRTTSGCAGALVWFALPERGRFVFSLVPHPGYDFRKVGVARHN